MDLPPQDTMYVQKPSLWRMILSALLCITLGGTFGVASTVLARAGEITPLGIGTVNPLLGANPLKKTTDNYPPSTYFPTTLSPRFEGADAAIYALHRTTTGRVTAAAYAAMDRDTGELLVAKNITEIRPIASVTKTMTAIVANEAATRDSRFIVSQSAVDKGEATMGLSVGESLSLEELLYGMMLPSGNDAAETLAEGVFYKDSFLPFSDDVARMKSRATFISRMNQKAHDIGMNDTFFANPTGLDEDTVETTSHSTALDLLALGTYYLENPYLAEIASTKDIEIPYQGHHKAFYLSNLLRMDDSYSGIRGIKPGNTDYAGETLLSYAENGGKRIVLVLLGSSASKDDAVKLYDYIFTQLGIQVLKP